MNGLETIWLLLPVATALAGWYAGRSTARRQDTGRSYPPLAADYFKGINYVLNEQPDKAIEAFIKVLEVDSETAETHLALGRLYRQRGEVDRAIRIHQNLIARESLELEQRHAALLELGRDYWAAGLFDRAEAIYAELVDSDEYQVQALQQLTEIYEQEKDWSQAISTARQLEQATGRTLAPVIAQYCCEEAERSRLERSRDAALASLAQALEVDENCARASLLRGDIQAEMQDWQSAISAYENVEHQDPDYLPETVSRLQYCCSKLGRTESLLTYLSRLLQRYGGTTVALGVAELKREHEGAPAAARFLSQRLSERPSLRGYKRFLELADPHTKETDEPRLALLHQLTDQLLRGRPVYQCQHCGFPAKSLHWQCPGCRHWDSVKPVRGVEGE